MASVIISAIGNAAGVVLPPDLLVKLQVGKGDTLYIIETPNGFELTPHRPDFATQMDAADSIMRENRDVLKKLAE